MADTTQTNNPFAKVFESVTANPFVKAWTDLNAPFCGTLKQVAAQYVDTSEEWAKKALELNEKLTSWAKETPLSPLFETQRSLASQLVENSAAFARRLWQIEAKDAEKEA